MKKSGMISTGRVHSDHAGSSENTALTLLSPAALAEDTMWNNALEGLEISELAGLFGGD